MPELIYNIGRQTYAAPGRKLQLIYYRLYLMAGKTKRGLGAGRPEITGNFFTMAGKAGDFVIGKVYAGICARVIIVAGPAVHDLHIVNTDRMAC